MVLEESSPSTGRLHVLWRLSRSNQKSISNGCGQIVRCAECTFRTSRLVICCVLVLMNRPLKADCDLALTSISCLPFPRRSTLDAISLETDLCASGARAVVNASTCRRRTAEFVACLPGSPDAAAGPVIISLPQNESATCSDTAA